MIPSSDTTSVHLPHLVGHVAVDLSRIRCPRRSSRAPCRCRSPGAPRRNGSPCPVSRRSPPNPAVAFDWPLGSTRAGQILRQVEVQAVLLGLRVYSVLPLTKMVPDLVLLAVETVTFLAPWMLAPAVPTPTSAADSPPRARAATPRRPTGAPRVLSSSGAALTGPSRSSPQVLRCGVSPYCTTGETAARIATGTFHGTDPAGAGSRAGLRAIGSIEAPAAGGPRGPGERRGEPVGRGRRGVAGARTGLALLVLVVGCALGATGGVIGAARRGRAASAGKATYDAAARAQRPDHHGPHH